MKTTYLLLLMALATITIQADAAENPLLQFDLNHFDDWTYHRQGVTLDHDLISQNRVTLFTTVNGERCTLESPEFSSQGIDSLKVLISYILDEEFNPTKVAPRIEVLDIEGNVLRVVDIPVQPAVIIQNLETMVDVAGLPDATLLFSAPKAKEAEGVFPAVKAIKVWAVSTGGTPHVPGDVNGDGIVDVSDVNIVINVMLGKNQDPQVKLWADLNDDGTVDVSDVNAVINIMLGKA